MLRSFFIYLSKAAWARKIVTGWSFAWKMASRFVAGDKLEDGIKAAQALNSKGINVSLDHLGEQTDSPEQARQAAQDIVTALDAIQQTGVRANVSIKLTQIGLAIDPELCAENLTTIVDHAHENHNFVRVDMEDSNVTQLTLDLLYRVRAKGYDNVGIVIQSYLYRSEEDIRKLADDCIAVRLCKGAYKEPASVAFPRKKDVDKSYDRLAELLIDGTFKHSCPMGSPDGRFPALVGLATHDPLRIEAAKACAAQKGVPKGAIEFQMLYGIRRELQDQLVAEGYPMRVYVPYGTEWYPYYMRRLAERPANIWFFVSNFFRR